MRLLAPGIAALLCACAPSTGTPEPTPGVAESPPIGQPPIGGGTEAETDPGDAPTEPEPYEMTGFSFVDELTAGLPQPGARVPLETDLEFLAGQGLALLVSLTIDPVPPEELAAFGMDGLHLPIPDMTAPTWEQQVALVDELTARAALGEAVGVHCTAGLGRTGTMLATWFVAGGMDAETAIATIRDLRPGSIETDEQEEAVRTFAARWTTER